MLNPIAFNLGLPSAAIGEEIVDRRHGVVRRQAYCTGLRPRAPAIGHSP